MRISSKGSICPDIENEDLSPFSRVYRADFINPESRPLLYVQVCLQVSDKNRQIQDFYILLTVLDHPKHRHSRPGVQDVPESWTVPGTS